MKTTINTHNGHTWNINEHNILTTKPAENLLLITEITTKDANDLKHATTTIRKLLESIPRYVITNTKTKETRFVNLEDVIEYLPEIDDRHCPLP